MDENQKRPQASLEFINLAEDVFNSRNPQLPEYLDFLQDVEFLKKSETFQKSSAIFENFDLSVEQFYVLQDCIGYLWRMESWLGDPQAKRICM